MGKILLRKDTAGIDKFMKGAEKVLKVVQPYVDNVRAIVSFEVTPDIFMDLLQDDFCEKTKAKIKESVTNELKGAGITSQFIHKASIDENIKSFDRIKADYEKEKQNLFLDNYSQYLQYLEYSKGKVSLTENFESETVERFSTYVTTSKGLELMELHKQFADAFNKFCAMLPKYKEEVTLSLIGWGGILNSVISKDEEGDFIPSTNMNYDFFYASNNASDYSEIQKIIIENQI